MKAADAMSVIPHPRVDTAESGLGDVVASFDAIADALSAEVELDDLLRLLAERMCGMLGIARCAVYLRDDDGGLFRGRVAHPIRREADAWMSRSVAGGEADRFSQEILRTRKPVFIANVRDDPRPMHSAMLDWGIWSMLGVPMVMRGEVIGLLFIDNAEVPYVYTETAQQRAAALASLGAVAVAQVRRGAEMRHTLENVVRQNRILRQVWAMDDQLSKQVLEGAGLEEIAASLASMTNHPCGIYNPAFERLAVGVCPGDDAAVPTLMDEDVRAIPDVASALAGLQSGEPRVVGPMPAMGLHRRHLVARAESCGETVGYVVLMDHRRNLTTVDAMLARRAATMVALTLSAERRALDAAAHARESLVRDLIHELDERASLARRACFHQLDLAVPHVVGLLTSRHTDPGSAPTLSDVRAVVERLGLAEPLFYAGHERGVVLLVPVPRDNSPRAGVAAAKAMIQTVIDQLPTDSVIAGVSPVCHSVEDYPRAFSECESVIKCMASLSAGDGVRVLAADDLGAGRLLLASSSPEMSERFALDAAGALLEPEQDRQQLLATLVAFCESHRNVRATGAALGIHENTVRYRLGKIAELTGLDVVANAEDQLTAQLAVLVFKLRGWLGGWKAESDRVDSGIQPSGCLDGGGVIGAVGLAAS
jgi:sugar diacid utilization regulator